MTYLLVIHVLCRVGVQGVVSLGGHFATLCQEFSNKREKGNTFYTFNTFYSEKSSNLSKIAQIYHYDPQSAGINVQSPQSESTL